MNDPHSMPENFASMSSEETRSALFAQMVMQQSSMAMMLLGKTSHPGTGEVVRDFEAARLFIDQLEMLEYKTRGNLTREETTLLQQSLMSLRMAFVEVVNSSPAPAESKPVESSAAPEPGHASAPAQTEPTPSGESPAEAESRKKFTKKY
jgi:hypothetical protein